MPQIHSTACVDPKARLHESVVVGPFTVIEAGVTLGANCRIGPHCHLLGDTTLGEDNIVHTGCVLGDTPQDLAYQGAPTQLLIGRGNEFRENVTVHRGAREGTATEIGDDNYFMVNCHMPHNCRIGHHVIMANAVLLGGYVAVEDRVFLGGGAVVHQFCRVGTLAILRGLARISQDVPPYCMAVENNELVGLNSIGMKRAGFSIEQRSQLKQAYATLFLNGLNVSQALDQIEAAPMSVETQHLAHFIRNSKRGICTARKRPTDLGEH